MSLRGSIRTSTFSSAGNVFAAQEEGDGALYESAVRVFVCVQRHGGLSLHCARKGGFREGGRPGMESFTAGLIAMPHADQFSPLVSAIQTSHT